MNELDEQLKDAICNDDLDFLIKNRDKYSIDHRFEDEDNDTLLMYSISYPDSHLYTYFLTNGADYSLKNSLGETIVHAVVFSGDVERMQNILESYSVNIDTPSTDDHTSPLLLAICLEKSEMAKYLIKQGADVCIADKDGLTPLHMAVQFNDFELVRDIVEHGGNLRTRTKAGNLPLALAINNSTNTDIIKYLYNLMYDNFLIN